MGRGFTDRVAGPAHNGVELVCHLWFVGTLMGSAGRRWQSTEPAGNGVTIQPFARVLGAGNGVTVGEWQPGGGGVAGSGQPRRKRQVRAEWCG
ncbi:hypothetical protein Q0Z83_088170 [Actinoplanes sichuanensis]|nr:hypothetical protein Q0Z83_088170 [Actinoplanes sichuanensis]